MVSCGRLVFSHFGGVTGRRPGRFYRWPGQQKAYYPDKVQCIAEWSGIPVKSVNCKAEAGRFLPKALGKRLPFFVASKKKSGFSRYSGGGDFWFLFIEWKKTGRAKSLPLRLYGSRRVLRLPNLIVAGVHGASMTHQPLEITQKNIHFQQKSHTAP